MENLQVYRTYSYARHHKDQQIDLGKEGEARVEISPTGWKVTSRWDKHNWGIKCLYFNQENTLGVQHTRAVSSAFSRPSYLLGTPSNYIARENSRREINAFKKLHELSTAQTVK